MFQNNRFLTCGVDAVVPLGLQLFLWDCVDQLSEPKDYLQVFDLKPVGCIQSITHRSEAPAYRKVYLLPSEVPINEKIYVIDDGDHSTMLLRARQREGIEAAKKKNVHFGRPSKPLPDNWREVLSEVRCGNKKPVDAMRELGISRSYYYRLWKHL